MSNSPNIGIPMPDEEDNIDTEMRRLGDAWLIVDAVLYALQAGLAGKSNVGHGHAIAAVSGLAAALEGKMPVGKVFSLAELSDVVGAAAAATNYILAKQIDGKFSFVSAASAIGAHQHGVNDIVGLVDLISSRISALVGSAPTTLDTLQEIADALGDDPNFATAITDLIGTKANSSHTISAGGIATGGGSLAANRTITVPKSTNAQAIAGTDDATAMTPLRVKDAISALAQPGINGIAGYSTSSTQNETNFPLGQVISVQGSDVPRRSQQDIRLSGAAHNYQIGGGNAQLTGAWRSCGGSNAVFTYQRVA